VHGQVTERSFLSDDLQQFCAGYPIYLVKKAQDSLAAARIETGGKRIDDKSVIHFITFSGEI